MPVQKTLTSWNTLQRPVDDAFWGPVTASIDWCEANYDVSRWIAEFCNTLSNIPFLLLAGFGIYNSRQNQIPSYLMLPFVGMAMIGTGSLLFHTTLSYRMQLLDELPMLYSTGFINYCAWETQTPGEKQAVPYIGTILTTIVSGVTVAYLLHPDPVLHQVAFGVIMITAVARSTYLCYTKLLDTPFEKQRNREITGLQIKGVALMVGAFLVWLVDCLACGHITKLKQLVGQPLSYLLELHAWWHLGTGAGAYYLANNLQLLVLSLREDPHNIGVEYACYGLLPHITRRKPHTNGHAKAH